MSNERDSEAKNSGSLANKLATATAEAEALSRAGSGVFTARGLFGERSSLVSAATVCADGAEGFELEFWSGSDVTGD